MISTKFKAHLTVPRMMNDQKSGCQHFGSWSRPFLYAKVDPILPTIDKNPPDLMAIEDGELIDAFELFMIQGDIKDL